MKRKGVEEVGEQRADEEDVEEEKDGEVLVEEEELAEEEELEEEEQELVEVVFEAGRAHLRPVAPGRPVGQHCSLFLTICCCQPELFLTF